jgi:hypothetical protein
MLVATSRYNSEVSCYERTRDQGTLGSTATQAVVEPLGGRFLYNISIGSR